MNDYDRFLGMARGELAHLSQIAARLLDEGRIPLAVHHALTSSGRRLLHDAYQAGRCEPAGVTDLDAELARVGS